MKALEMAARKKYSREFEVLATDIKKVENEYPHSKTTTFFLKTNFGMIIINAMDFQGDISLSIAEYSNKELDIIKSM